MKLARWSFHAINMPYRRSVRWSDSSESSATSLLLRVWSDEGHEGVAEGTVKPTWSGTSVRSLLASIEDLLLPRLSDLNLASPEVAPTAFARIPENSMAKSMVANALWDLRAAASGKAAWQIWQGDSRVATSWTVTRDTPQAMARDAAGMTERYGFRTLKIKGGQGRNADLSIFRAIRDAVGPDMALYVDANGAYAQSEAASYVSALADEGAIMVEDPYPLAPNPAFTECQRISTVPIIVDFNCATAGDADLFLGSGARALSVKPGRVGIDEAMAIAGAAAAQECMTHVGLFGETDLGSLVALQLAASLPGRASALPAEPTVFLMMAQPLLKQTLKVENGIVEFPAMTSIASMVDWDAVASLAIE